MDVKPCSHSAQWREYRACTAYDIHTNAGRVVHFEFVSDDVIRIRYDRMVSNGLVEPYFTLSELESVLWFFYRYPIILTDLGNEKYRVRRK